MAHNCKGRILLAEDNEELAMGLAALLRQHGFCCTAAGSAQDALAALDRRHHDLLLSDIRMPGANGLALIREVQARALGMPVILLTGFPSVDTAMEAVRLGVVAYLIKPPNLKELFALVETEVERYRTVLEFQEKEAQLREVLDRLQREYSEQASSEADRGAAIRAKRDLGILDELRSLLDAFGDLSSGTPRRFEPAKLQEALRHTIDTLDSARTHFKSRELGQLRRHLESVLDRN